MAQERNPPTSFLWLSLLTLSNVVFLLLIWWVGLRPFPCGPSLPPIGFLPFVLPLSELHPHYNKTKQIKKNMFLF